MKHSEELESFKRTSYNLILSTLRQINKMEKDKQNSVRKLEKYSEQKEEYRIQDTPFYRRRFQHYENLELIQNIFIKIINKYEDECNEMINKCMSHFGEINDYKEYLRKCGTLEFESK